MVSTTWDESCNVRHKCDLVWQSGIVSHWHTLVHCIHRSMVYLLDSGVNKCPAKGSRKTCPITRAMRLKGSCNTCSPTKLRRCLTHTSAREQMRQSWWVRTCAGIWHYIIINTSLSITECNHVISSRARSPQTSQSNHKTECPQSYNNIRNVKDIK